MSRRSTGSSLRLPLRPRLVLTCALVTISATLLVSATTFLLAQRYLVDQRERSAVRQTFLNARLVRDILQAGGQEPQAILDGTVGEVGTLALLRVQGKWFASGVAADPSDLPASLVVALDDGSVAHQRIIRAGRPRLIIGVTLPASNAQYVEIIPLDGLQHAVTVTSLRSRHRSTTWSTRWRSGSNASSGSRPMSATSCARR